jgi:hypothetical protein
MEPLARKHKTWYKAAMTAKSDSDHIKNATATMEEVFNDFMVSALWFHRDTLTITVSDSAPNTDKSCG